jgi:hypothetical protein
MISLLNRNDQNNRAKEPAETYLFVIRILDDVETFWSVA